MQCMNSVAVTKLMERGGGRQEALVYKFTYQSLAEVAVYDLKVASARDVHVHVTVLTPTFLNFLISTPTYIQCKCIYPQDILTVVCPGGPCPLWSLG